VLAHDALEAALAGVSEDKLPVIVLQVLIAPQPRACVGQNGTSTRLAHIKGLPIKVS
jgi:hypothetical protein